MTPYDWQVPHINRLEQALRTGGVAIDGSSTGVGKTVCAAEVARRGGGLVFVVCPKAVIPSWTRTLAAFGITPVGVVNYEKLKMGNTPFGHWDRQKWTWTLPKGTLIIFDEARRCFPGNTLVETPRGPVPIKLLKPGELVCTPLGPRKVLKKIVSGTLKPLVEVLHEKGSLVCTGDHPVFVNNVGFTPAHTINKNTHALITVTSQDLPTVRKPIHPKSKTAAFLRKELQHDPTDDIPLFTGGARGCDQEIVERPSQQSTTNRKNAGLGSRKEGSSRSCYETLSLPFLQNLVSAGKEDRDLLLAFMQSPPSVHTKPPRGAGRIKAPEEPHVRPPKSSPKETGGPIQSREIPLAGPQDPSCEPRSPAGETLPLKTRRERVGDDQTSRKTLPPPRTRLGSRSVPLVGTESFDLAHHARGSGEPENSSSHRSRRPLPRIRISQNPRPSKGNPSPGAGVEAPSRHQQRGSVDHPNQLVPSSVKSVRTLSPTRAPLYDIEVEEAHCFFAEGVLVHNCKATGSQNAKMLRDSVGHPLLLLSATLAESPLDLRAVLHVSGICKWSAFFGWLLRNGCRKAVFGGFELIPQRKDETFAYLHDELFRKRGSRIRIAELGDLFPETQITAEAFDLGDPDAIQRVYDEMEEELSDLADAAKNDGAMNPLTIQLRARQKTELLKVPGVAALAQNYVDEGNSVVIFTNFKASLDALCEKLGTDCAIYGGQSASSRQDAIDRFQRDEARIIVVNIQAGGEGISLHDINGNYPRVSLLFPTYSASDLRQALGRIRRSGGKSKSLQRILFAAGTVEEKVCSRVQKKLENIDRLNDGDLNFSENNLNEPQDPVSDPSPSLSNLHTMSQTETTEQPRDIKEVSDGAAPDHKHSSRAHSRHSPSSLLNKVKCCGWENDNSPDRDTTAADRGTVGHEMIETRNFDLAPEDEALTKAARMCAEFLDGMAMRMERVHGAPVTEHKEFRVPVLDQFGNVDHLFVCGSEGRMVDFKFANTDHYSADSPQFWAYAVGVFDKFPDIQVLHVYVLLPFRDEVDKVIWSRENDYQRLVGQVGAILTAAKNPDPEKYVIGRHCTWCAKLVQGKCPKFARIAEKLAMQYSGEEEPYRLPENLPTVHGSLVEDPAVTAKLYRIAGLMEKAAAGWKKAALEKRLSGIDIPGFDLAERRGSRAITDATAAYEAVKDRLSAEDLVKASKLSIGSLEELWANTFKRGEKGGSLKLLMERLIDCDAVTSGAPVQYLRETA